MSDIEDLREAYLAERARYEKLASWVGSGLSVSIKERGIVAQVSGRAKEVPNLLRKAIKKGYSDPLNDITDKAGVRVIVPYQFQVDEVTAIVRESLEVVEYENKVAGYRPDQLGYLGVHLLVKPRVDLLNASNQDLKELTCEIQIHTRAQNAWSEISHPLLYKPTGPGPATSVQRRVHRLLSLVEMFDEEVERARADIRTAPGYVPAAMLQVLEREYLLVAPSDYDAELSLSVLEVVATAYSTEELQEFEGLVTNFMNGQREEIKTLLDQHRGDQRVDPLLFQPEMIAIAERLTNSAHLLRSRWDQQLPPSLLSTLSSTLGRPI